MTNRNRAVLWVLAVFLLGAFSGGTLVYLLGIPGSTRPAARRSDFRSSPEEAFQHLAKDLDLTPEQKPQVKKIFEDGRHDSEEAFKKIQVKTRERLKEVLLPKQLTKFDQFTEEMRKRHERRRAPRQ